MIKNIKDGQELMNINYGLVGNNGYWGKILSHTLQKLDLHLVKTCDLIGNGLDDIPHSTNLKDILSDNEINAVLIATPPSTHFEIAYKCLTAGKHCFVEKPLSLNYKDARELEYIARSNELILMVDSTFVFSPEIRFIKDSLTLHRFGSPTILRSTRANYGPFSEDCSVIWDLLVHDISILYALFGKPYDVSAVGTRTMGAKHYEDCRANFSYINSPDVCNIHVSWLSKEKVRQLEIITDKGFITTKFDGYVKFESFDKKTNVFTMADKLSPLEVELNYFNESIKNNKQPISNGANACEIVSILNTVEDSCHHFGEPRRL